MACCSAFNFVEASLLLAGFVVGCCARGGGFVLLELNDGGAGIDEDLVFLALLPRFGTAGGSIPGMLD